jgi:D-glycero-D-manno-heptose 1,7-bisphosphate phosphatase
MSKQEPMNRAPAVFLDRDGTIIEDRGYLKHPDQVTFLPGAIQALLQLQTHFKLFMVTNQQGIAEGILSRDDVDTVNNYIIAQLQQAGIEIIATYVCPHRREDNCDCIKPKPFFLKKAATDYNINLNKSFVIGDHPHDVEFAYNVGACGIYVLTGHGERHKDKLQNDTIVVAGIKEATKIIINYSGNDL